MKFYKYKFRIGLLVGIVALLMVAAMFPEAAISDEKYKLHRSAISMAGGQAQSTTYSVEDAIGQSSPVGSASSPTYRVSSGYIGDVASGIIISAPHLSGSAGVTIAVPLYVEDVTNKNITALSITVETESSLLPLSISYTGALLGQWSTILTNIEGTKLKIVAAGTIPLSGSGILVNLQYQVAAAAPDNSVLPIHFAEVLFNEGEPAALPQDGSYTVSGGYSVSGGIAYYSNSQPVANATLNLNEFQTQSNVDGLFSFSDIPAGNYQLTPEKSGDLGNGIGAYDAALILQYAASLISLTPYQMIAADVTSNGGVTAYDASYILRYVVGLVSDFPTGEDWKFVPATIHMDLNNWSTAPDHLLYSPLNSDQVNQNFVGLILGDVSGNWSPPGQLLASLPRETIGTATVQWGEISRFEQKQITIPICFSEANEILSAEIKIVFDDEILEFRGLNLPVNSEDLLSEYQTADGVLTIAIAGSRPSKISDELIRLTFDVVDPKNNNQSTLKIEALNLNDGRIQVFMANQETTFNSVAPTSFSLSQNYPNPFNPETTIRYELPLPANVELTIFDLQGKEVTALARTKQTTGRYSLVWNGCNSSGQKVASGVYFYRITIEPDEANQNTFSQTRKMILMK
ncbi:MAG: cohesin domain-containing protein [Candidatus Zhuqueibacterota bacterium]